MAAFVAIALIATIKKYGFNNLRYEEPLEFDEVDAEGCSSSTPRRKWLKPTLTR